MVLVLLVAFSMLLSTTVFGRHVYAVGGNAEAARRAGINVPRIRLLCFVLCSTIAAIAGILLASRVNSVTPTTGGGETLLYAVGAAVIGGTSLFGGKGRPVDADHRRARRRRRGQRHGPARPVGRRRLHGDRWRAAARGRRRRLSRRRAAASGRA